MVVYRLLFNFWCTVCGLVLFFSASAQGAEFFEEVERDFTLRSIGQLQVTNLRGGITIQGWALDRIRVRARRKAIAATREEAAKMFSAADFRYRAIDGDIELSAEYGRGLSIQERLQERSNPRTSMEMIVMAPANLALRVWALDGSVSVKSWGAPVQVRTAAGAIQIEDVRKGDVSLLCPSCVISVKRVKGSVRCMGGTGNVDLSDSEGNQIYVETTSGNQRIQRLSAEQLYVSTTGVVDAQKLKGRIEFHTQSGAVSVDEGVGFVSGRTESGNISLKMKEFKFDDKAIIESVSGNIALSLPFGFSADLEAWSVMGKVQLGFPLHPSMDRRSFYGPQPANHLQGLVGEGGEQLRVSSHSGDVRLSLGR